MGTIRQYRPSFFSGFKNAVEKYDTMEQLLEIPFVKNFRMRMGTRLPGDMEGIQDERFIRYSISDMGEEIALLAEYKDRSHYVIGFSDRNDVICSLPRWSKSQSSEDPATTKKLLAVCHSPEVMEAMKLLYAAFKDTDCKAFISYEYEFSENKEGITYENAEKEKFKFTFEKVK